MEDNNSTTDRPLCSYSFFGYGIASSTGSDDFGPRYTNFPKFLDCDRSLRRLCSSLFSLRLNICGNSYPTGVGENVLRIRQEAETNCSLCLKIKSNFYIMPFYTKILFMIS